MLLYQTKHSPHHSTWFNESGQVLYKATTPNIIYNSVTTVSRVIPNSGPPLQLEGFPTLSHAGPSTPDSNKRSPPSKADYDSDTEGSEGGWDKDDDGSINETVYDEKDELLAQDRFEQLGKIEWHLFTASVFEFNGERQKVSDFFSKQKLGPRGRDRAFVAPDGRKYKWKMDWWSAKLLLDDGSSPPKLIARLRRTPLFQMTRSKGLMIDPESENILDWILFTYIYVERVRKNRERASRNGGGGGGGDGG